MIFLKEWCYLIILKDFIVDKGKKFAALIELVKTLI